MTEKNTTLNKDINLIERDCGYWDYEFQYGDLVLSEDKQSLRNGLIIACLTSWNYLNRQGNPTYEVFGNKSYWELKKKKSSMREYLIKQYFIEVLNRIRRVHRVIDLQVLDHSTDPNAYSVYFTVEAVNDEIVNGSFNIGTDKNLPSSYMEVTLSSDYASNDTPLQINITLKNEYGNGVSDEIIYMYIKNEDDEFHFYKSYGSTDENGCLTINYIPSSSNEINSIYFVFKGNNEYNQCSSEHFTFKSEIYNYFLMFDEEYITTHSNTTRLNLKLYKKASTQNNYEPVKRALIRIQGSDHKHYNAITNEEGVCSVEVEYDDNTTYTATYQDQKTQAYITVLSETPSLTYECNESIYYKEPLRLEVSLTDSLGQTLKNQKIELYIDNELTETVSLEDNIALFNTLTNHLSLGEHTITLKLVESKFYNETITEPYTFTVIERALNIIFTSNYTELYCDETLSLEATATDNFNEAVPNLPITLYEDSYIFQDNCSSADGLSNYDDVIKLVGNSSGTIEYDSTENAYKLKRTVNYSNNSTWYIMFPILSLQGEDNIVIEADIKGQHVAYNRIGFGCADSNGYALMEIGHDDWTSGLRFCKGTIGHLTENYKNYNFPNDNTIWYHCKFYVEGNDFTFKVYDMNRELLSEHTGTYEVDSDTRDYGIVIGCPYNATAFIKNISVKKNEMNQIITSNTDTDGMVTFLRYNLNEGEYGYSISIGELENYDTNMESISLDYPIRIIKHTPTIDLTVNDSLLVVGNTYDITATVTSEEGLINDVEVRFYKDNVLIETEMIKDGIATIPLTFDEVGEYTINAMTVEDNLYNTASDQITLAVLDHDYSADINMTYNEFDYTNKEITGTVSFSMKDYGTEFDYEYVGAITLNCEETDDEWTMMNYNPNNSFNVEYRLSEEDNTDSFTFNLTLNNEPLSTETFSFPTIQRRNTNLTVTQEQSTNITYLTGRLTDGVSNESLANKTVNIYNMPTAIDHLYSNISIYEGSGTKEVLQSFSYPRIRLSSPSSETVYSFNCDEILFSSNVQVGILGSHYNMINTTIDDSSFSSISIIVNLSQDSENKTLTISSGNSVLFEKVVNLNETLGDLLVNAINQSISVQIGNSTTSPKILLETVETNSLGQWETNGIDTNEEITGNYNIRIEFEGNKFYNSTFTTTNWQW